MRALLSVLAVLACLVMFGGDVFCQSPIDLKLPFRYGESWTMTRGYNCAGEATGASCSHTLYSGSDERYALDFAQSGCAGGYGMPMLAMASGTLQIGSSLDDNGWGVNAWIYHANDCRSRYAHMIEGSLQYPSERYVLQGDMIGRVGNTGNVSSGCTGLGAGAHIHIVFQCKDTSGNYVGVKPEPMSDYQAFMPGGGYVSNNTGEIGHYSDGWHEDGSSQAFFDAYVRSRWTGIGVPKQDSGNPSGIYVHCWLDSDNVCTCIDVQNFENSDPGKRGAILYRQGKDKAHMVRGKVWDWYRFHLNSPRTYGAPTADEGAWTDPSDGKVFPISQEFEKVRLAFDDVGSTPDREIPISQVTSAMIPIAPRDTAKDGTVGIAGGSSLYPAFTGGHEKHMLLVADQVTSSYVTFTITDETGIPCNTYRLNRNGIMLLDTPGTVLTISDNGVSPNMEYTYDLECRLASGGAIGKSDSLNVKTPPNPRTYELLAYARDGYSAYLEIRDTLLIYFYPLHAILTVETCENADYKRRLMGTENSNKHKKLFCKMIFI